ncbi:MAG: hypothetical protein AAF636_04190 [Pseudomonadota bacterium]
MRALIFVISVFLPTLAYAGPDRLSVLLGTEHFNATRDFQEFNPGLFLTWESTYDYSVGLFYNSYEEVSPIVTVGRDWEVAPNFDLGVFGGLAIYPGDGDEFRISAGDLVPLVGLQARYGNVFAQFIPADGDSVDAVLAIGLTFELNP